MNKGDAFAERFRAIRLIHGGNQSEVWLCRDLDSEDDDRVALKILSGNDNELLREFFKRETEALSLCQHEGIVKILDSGYDHNSKKYWIALEYIEGVTLEEKLKSAYDDGIAIKLLLDVTDAVGNAHSKDIIHRDLKPSNIMIDVSGTIKIVDFGISKIKSLLQDGATVGGFGTPPYTSPEQIAMKEVDQRTDVYSLGVIFFRMIGGNVPTVSSPIINQVLESEIKEEFKEILCKMVCINKEERYPSVLHVKRELMKLSKDVRKHNTVIYVQSTQNFINKLVSLEMITIGAESEAVSWLNKEFNSNQLYIEKGKLENDWVIHVNKYKIFAIQDLNSQFFLIKNILFTSATDMARNVEYSFLCEVTWKALSKKMPVPKNTDLELFIDEVLTWKRISEVKRQKELQHKKTLSQWDNILRLQRKYLIEKEFFVSYTTWDISEDQSNLEVDLVNEIEYPSLFIEKPVLMDSVEEKKRIKVGTVVEMEGRKLLISLDRGVITDDIKEFGELTLDNKQVNAALKRQEDALRSVKYGDSKNPKLFEIIENPSISEVSQVQLESYFNDNLDSAKKEAISSTLGSEFYLIQGPPGTGKTKVISEIIVQLINQNPGVRILLTSQSNAAVDNALEATANLTDKCSFLRIGRKDKIGDKISEYQLEESLNLWILKTTQRSNEYTQNLDTIKHDHLKELGDAAAKLADLGLLNTELIELYDEISIAKYKYYENSHDDEVNRELLGILQKDLQLKEDEYKLKFSEILLDLKCIAKTLKLKVEWDRVFTATDISKIITFLERELERNRKALNSLDQIEVIRQEWLKRLGKGREFEAICAGETQVIASTCLGTANIPGVWSAEYDWVIVDEAGRATPPEILVPLVRGKRILLVGDHKQLPPIVDSEFKTEDLEKFEIKKSFLEISLFEDIFNRAGSSIKSTLNIQYRMHSGIGQLISEVFYEGTIRNADSTETLIHPLPNWEGKSVVWITTSAREDRFESSSQSSKSKENQLEAKLILEECEKANKVLKELNRKLTVGIISGYTDQKLLIEQLINPKDSIKWSNIDIEVDNVDAFQGQERDVIFYSIVRSNKKRDIGFLKDYRRLNVALSRARKLLLIVGDLDMVINANTYDTANSFAEVIKHIQKVDTKNCLIEVCK
ncbi:serine/threonine-protein kinase [Paenibacillus polymyxa]|uniref:serine/threonine-protein kinase n=1 Tax=Paenibacillus polymyxa TaxID=1406 RepID=UPI002024B70B|nr:serine/threonine-protein kinase [Paenibacillus polymyxa]WDZ54909.1 AAA domain-containing protein [Paenibacillus polymyxa]